MILRSWLIMQARIILSGRIALIVELIEMNCNIKRLVCGVCVVVMLGFFVGGASAAASYTEEVKFKGVVTGYPDFGGAVGTGGANVQIDKILFDPTGNLTIGDNVTVSWPIAPPFADINVTVGDRAEVYGYRNIKEMPGWWSGVGEHWVSLNTSDHYLRWSDIRLIGTAIEYFEDPGTGARYGWNVSVDKLISGPQPCSNRLNVTLQAVPPPWGNMDQNITEGDAIEVYGDYCEDQNGCCVSLVGSEDYYIRSIHKGDLNRDNQITPADAAIALEIATGGSASCDTATLAAADVSGDDKVTSLDALMILQAGTGTITL